MLNQGNSTAVQPWTDRVILSTNTVFGDGDDVFLGGGSQIHLVDVAGGATYTDTMTVTIGTSQAAGTYNLLFKTDISGNVVETNEGNNVSATAIAITVQ